MGTRLGLSAFAAKLCLTPEAASLRRAIFLRQSDVARSIWPQAILHPVGSFQQNTSLRDSDLDVLLMLPSHGDSREEMVQAAQSLKSQVMNRGLCKSGDCRVVSGARVPILSYVDQLAKPGIRVDVSFQRDNAIRNTAYIKKEMEERPYMRDILLLMKYWTKNRQLHEVYLGGLGSYALSLTVIGFFNHQKLIGDFRHRDCIAREDTYGLLMQYLDFWLKRWYFELNCMIPSTGEIVRKEKRGYSLSLIDPGDPTNDVGQSAFKIKKVMAQMKELRYQMGRIGSIGDEAIYERLFGVSAKERKRLLKLKYQTEADIAKRTKRRQGKKEKVARRRERREKLKDRVREIEIQKAFQGLTIPQDPDTKDGPSPGEVETLSTA